MDDLIKRLREPRDLFAQPTITRWWKERLEAADRIEALERKVKAADALADEMERLIRRTPFVPAPNGISVTIGIDQVADQRIALAAYRATKEGGA